MAGGRQTEATTGIPGSTFEHDTAQQSKVEVKEYRSWACSCGCCSGFVMALQEGCSDNCSEYSEKHCPGWPNSTHGRKDRWGRRQRSRPYQRPQPQLSLSPPLLWRSSDGVNELEDSPVNFTAQKKEQARPC